MKVSFGESNYARALGYESTRTWSGFAQDFLKTDAYVRWAAAVQAVFAGRGRESALTGKEVELVALRESVSSVEEVNKREQVETALVTVNEAEKQSQELQYGVVGKVRDERSFPLLMITEHGDQDTIKARAQKNAKAKKESFQLKIASILLNVIDRARATKELQQNASAIAIQSWMRTFVPVRKIAKAEKAAVVIQKVFRGFQGRKEAKGEKDRESVFQILTKSKRGVSYVISKTKIAEEVGFMEKEDNASALLRKIGKEERAQKEAAGQVAKTTENREIDKKERAQKEAAGQVAKTTENQSPENQQVMKRSYSGLAKGVVFISALAAAKENPEALQALVGGVTAATTPVIAQLIEGGSGAMTGILKAAFSNR